MIVSNSTFTLEISSQSFFQAGGTLHERLAKS